jgi:hypothetical protein
LFDDCVTVYLLHKGHAFATKDAGEQQRVHRNRTWKIADVTTQVE